MAKYTTKKQIEVRLKAIDKEIILADREFNKAEGQYDRYLNKLSQEHEGLEQQLEDFDDQQSEVEAGNIPDAAQAARIKDQKFSFAIHFERRNGEVFVSERRFSNSKEANQHGKRFAKKHKHAGYQVVRTSKKANAWINWTTGLTNPVK